LTDARCGPTIARRDGHASTPDATRVDPFSCSPTILILGNGESDPGRRSVAGAHGALDTDGRNRGGRSPRCPGTCTCPPTALAPAVSHQISGGVGHSRGHARSHRARHRVPDTVAGHTIPA
jgi:hypothetical protein